MLIFQIKTNACIIHVQYLRHWNKTNLFSTADSYFNAYYPAEPQIINKINKLLY